MNVEQTHHNGRKQEVPREARKTGTESSEAQTRARDGMKKNTQCAAAAGNLGRHTEEEGGGVGTSDGEVYGTEMKIIAD